MKFLFATGFALSLLSTTVFPESAKATGPIQPVYSLKNLGETVVNGEAFKKLEVRCNTHDQLRYIHRNQGSEEWCAYGLGDKCSDDRIEAAGFACLMSSNEVAALSREAPAPLVVDPDLKQRLEQRKKLEDELYALEQKRIEIRQRQLELRKREVELSAKLEQG